MYRFMLVAMLATWVAIVAAQNATPVNVGTVGLAPIIEEVPLTGTITSPRAARLSTAVGGLVERVYVDAGDRVEQGKVMLILDPEIEEIPADQGPAAYAVSLLEAEHGHGHFLRGSEVADRPTA